MRTIRMKIITGILMCSLLTALVIGILAIANSTQLVSKDAKEKMQGHFGKVFRPDLMRRAEAEVKESLPNDERSLWRYLDQKRRKQRETMRQKPPKRDYKR